MVILHEIKGKLHGIIKSYIKNAHPFILYMKIM